jgi:hypothetical protein
MISWGISKGYKWFRSSGLNYDPKAVLGGSAQWISQQKIRSDNVLTNSGNRATGRDDEFWNQAERELQEAEDRGNPAKEIPDDI